MIMQFVHGIVDQNRSLKAQLHQAEAAAEAAYHAGVAQGLEQGLRQALNEQDARRAQLLSTVQDVQCLALGLVCSQLLGALGELGPQLQPQQAAPAAEQGGIASPATIAAEPAAFLPEQPAASHINTAEAVSLAAPPAQPAPSEEAAAAPASTPNSLASWAKSSTPPSLLPSWAESYASSTPNSVGGEQQPLLEHQEEQLADSASSLPHMPVEAKVEHVGLVQARGTTLDIGAADKREPHAEAPPALLEDTDSQHLPAAEVVFRIIADPRELTPEQLAWLDDNVDTHFVYACTVNEGKGGSVSAGYVVLPCGNVVVPMACKTVRHHYHYNSRTFADEVEALEACRDCPFGSANAYLYGAATGGPRGPYTFYQQLTIEGSASKPKFVPYLSGACYPPEKRAAQKVEHVHMLPEHLYCGQQDRQSFEHMNLINDLLAD